MTIRFGVYQIKLPKAIFNIPFGFGGSKEDSTIKKPLTDGDDLEEINKITEICSLLNKSAKFRKV